MRFRSSRLPSIPLRISRATTHFQQNDISMTSPLLDRLLSFEQSVKFLKTLSSNPELKIEFLPQKSRCTVYNKQNEKLLDFHFPLCFPAYKKEQSLAGYTHSISSAIPAYIILLMRAGQSSLGYFQHGILEQHKVIRKYMVRKKQGKAQIRFQQKKHASSLGARIRMANTVSFFEEINSKLQEWFELNQVDKIIYSCTPLLWSSLFRSKIHTPFDKGDERLIRIPLHIPTPDFKTLRYINHVSLSGKYHSYDSSQGEKLIGASGFSI
jgi:hypothetical protein